MPCTACPTHKNTSTTLATSIANCTCVPGHGVAAAQSLQEPVCVCARFALNACGDVSTHAQTPHPKPQTLNPKPHHTQTGQTHTHIIPTVHAQTSMYTNVIPTVEQ
jgi:hypothetical protein